MWGDRSGSEPRRARSPWALRRGFALVGGIICAVAFVLLLLANINAWLAGLFLLFAVLGLADAAVLTRRLRRQRD